MKITKITKITKMRKMFAAIIMMMITIEPEQ